jgi:hypothetical protein
VHSLLVEIFDADSGFDAPTKHCVFDVLQTLLFFLALFFDLAVLLCRHVYLFGWGDLRISIVFNFLAKLLHGFEHVLAC